MTATAKPWEHWQECLNILQQQNTRAGFDAVFKNSTAYMGVNQLVIVAQSGLSQELMANRQDKAIKQAIRTVYPDFNGTEVVYRYNTPDLQAEIDSLNRVNRQNDDQDLILGYMAKKEASSQYFRRYWRPLLGPTLSELIRELRQRGYYGKEDDGPKEEIHVRFDTLAQALGVSLSTLKRCLKRDKTGKFVRSEYLYLFITSMETITRYDPEKGRNVKDHTKFMIKQIDPIAPQHKDIFSKCQNDT